MRDSDFIKMRHESEFDFGVAKDKLFKFNTNKSGAMKSYSNLGHTWILLKFETFLLLFAIGKIKSP